MQNQFTQKAQNVLALALTLAREMGHTYIGSEHLLLALATEKDSISERVLRGRKLAPDRLRGRIGQLSGIGTPGYLSSEDMTPRLRLILEDAGAECLRKNGRFIGTEHLLLALLHRRDCAAVRLLEEEGISSSDLKHDLEAYLSVSVSPNASAKGSAKAGGEPCKIKGAPTLSVYGIDMTEQAEQGAIDPVIGRDRESMRVIQILSRRTKNNPCLVGEPGVGKTAVVEGLALRIAEGRVPEPLKDRRLILLDIPSMIAGAKYRGEFEERLKKVMGEVRKNPDIILFVDEIHMVVGAGAAEGAIDAANILKPAMARGEIQLIGATTPAEYRTHIEKDAALERRFQVVEVEEPCPADAAAILYGLRKQYEAHHGLTITDGAIEAAVALSQRYLPDRFLPDKAIDLLDEAASRVRLSACESERQTPLPDQRLRELCRKKEEAILSGQLEEAARLRNEEQKLRLPPSEEPAFPKADRSVTAAHVAEILTARTGIPGGRLLEEESVRLLSLEQTLRQRIVGQEAAIHALTLSIRRGRVGLKAPERPIGSFLFLGDSGVGKTALCAALAEELFGSQKALIRLDMSEYMEKHSVSKLVGSPPGYVGYGEGGQLTERIRRRPYSVLLLDEVEKAHPDVFHLLLQVLEDGTLTDSCGRKVDFSNTVIIMTSNLGSGERRAPVTGFGDRQAAASPSDLKDRMRYVKEQFRPEFLNRLDEIILFNPLGPEDLTRIAEQMLDDVVKRMEGLGLRLRFREELPRFLGQLAWEERNGARPLRRLLVSHVEDVLAELLLTERLGEGDSILLCLEGHGVQPKILSSSASALALPAAE